MKALIILVVAVLALSACNKKDITPKTPVQAQTSSVKAK